ncbi:unnamed protein product [Effrenium voratum]|nr:unnamed protein product [Effrenium voratum]
MLERCTVVLRSLAQTLPELDRLFFILLRGCASGALQQRPGSFGQSVATFSALQGLQAAGPSMKQDVKGYCANLEWCGVVWWRNVASQSLWHWGNAASRRNPASEGTAASEERGVAGLGPHALDFLEAAVARRNGVSVPQSRLVGSLDKQAAGFHGTLGQVLGRRWLFSSLRGAARMKSKLAAGRFRKVVDELTLVVPVDLDPWEVTWDFSQNLKLPSMRFAVVLHLDVSASCRFSRVSAAFPEELTLNVARCLQEQIQQWDLREIDPRFAGFTQPARVTFDLEAEWISQQMLRLTTKNLGSRLDLPAS